MITTKSPIVKGSTDRSALSEDNFQFLQSRIHQHSGIVIEKQKQYLLEARLSPLLTRRKLGSLNDLSALLRTSADSSLMSEVIESMTTHESYFYRDEAQFDALRTKLLPDLMSRRQARKRLSFWSAASSSGQEAYTIAMTLLEMQALGWGFDILATDLSERILARARTGVYSGHEVGRGTFPDYLKKHFEQSGGDWRLKEAIRKMVQFRKFDLRQEMRSLGTFDVIFCRNVLIYFDQPTKRKIFEGLASVLAPDGILMLGSTETTLTLTERFVRKTTGNAVYYQLLPKS